LRYEDILDLLVYEEKKAYEEFLENFKYYNNDNGLGQFDTEYWFNDKD